MVHVLGETSFENELDLVKGREEGHLKGFMTCHRLLILFPKEYRLEKGHIVPLPCSHS